MNTTDYNDNESIFAPAAYMTKKATDLIDRDASTFLFVYRNAIEAVIVSWGRSSGGQKIKSLVDPIIDKLATYPGVEKHVERLLVPDWDNLATTSMSLAGILTIMGSLAGLMSRQATSTSLTPSPGSKTAKTKLNRRHDPGQMMTLGSGILTMDSRLLGAAEVKLPEAKIADYLKKSLPIEKEDAKLRLHFNLGSKLSTLGNGTSLHPAWRTSYIHTVVTALGGVEAPTLREWAPNTASYVNEVGLCIDLHRVVEAVNG